METYFYSSCIIAPGHITVFDNITFTLDSDFNGDSPQFTLICISTGGPATTVTWTRDSITLTEGTETVLNNAVTAQYTHTLNVTAAGYYRCTVSNTAFSASADITLEGILYFRYECFNDLPTAP